MRSPARLEPDFRCRDSVLVSRERRETGNAVARQISLDGMYHEMSMRAGAGIRASSNYARACRSAETVEPNMHAHPLGFRASELEFRHDTPAVAPDRADTGGAPEQLLQCGLGIDWRRRQYKRGNENNDTHA